ncbi:MAG: YicC/YloC family endoribonuclease, partial [Arenicellales bacterium]
MTASMTAFSRNHMSTSWGQLIWEIRSVNHRYLDISFRLP